MNPKTKQIISEAFYREYEWRGKGLFLHLLHFILESLSNFNAY